MTETLPSRVPRDRAASGKVLVLGSDTRSFLSVIRSLGRRGIQVHVAWCPPELASLRSRYVARVHELPPAGKGDGDWRPALVDLLRAEAFDLVIPCNEQALIPLQLHRAELEPLARLAILDDRSFETVIDKIRTHELAESLGIPLPRSVRVARREQIPAALSAFDYPVVVKPRASFSADDLFNRNWVSKADSPEALGARLEALVPRGEVMVQENFLGAGVGVELIALGGEVLVDFQHERLHEVPLEGGASTYRRSVDVHPELREASATLMRALGYTGVAMVEFKLAPGSGAWVLLEINGRFWGSLPLALAAGADFPSYLYDMLVHGRREFPRRYRRGIHARNLKADLLWNWLNLRADHGDPTLGTRSLGQLLGELGPAVTLRERWDTFTLDDPRPGLVELGQLARQLAVAVSRALARGARALPPVRAARRRRLRARLAAAHSAVFVCMGNICRSPFAEHRARKLLPEGFRVGSSGYFPVSGRRSPSEAVEVAREFEVDLEPHRSAVIDARTVAEADVVFVFDDENRRTLRRRFPDAKPKIFELGLLADDGPDGIADPYGDDAAGFRTTYARIEQALRALPGWLRSRA